MVRVYIENHKEYTNIFLELIHKLVGYQDPRSIYKRQQYSYMQNVWGKAKEPKSQNNLNKNSGKEFTLPNFKAYYKTTVILLKPDSKFSLRNNSLHTLPVCFWLLDLLLQKPGFIITYSSFHPVSSMIPLNQTLIQGLMCKLCIMEHYPGRVLIEGGKQDTKK